MKKVLSVLPVFGTRRMSKLTRLALAVSLLSGVTLSAVTAVLLDASPAAAAGTYTCTTPATGTSSTTFYTGVNNTYAVSCYGVSGVSGTPAYPASLTLATGTAIPGSTQGTTTSSTPACVQSTSGSGTTEHYILTCTLTDNPTPSQVGSFGPYSWTANPGTAGGTAVTSGTVTITVSNTTQACIAPTTAGTATTFDEGYTDTFSVQCENETHVSGQAQYPSSIALTSGTGPVDAPVTFSTSTSSTPPCVQSTSGSGTTEEYILTCSLSFAPTTSDAGAYPFTFTPTTNTVAGPTSGTLTVNVAAETLTCTAPAVAGTSTTFNSSPGGTANSFAVACYGTGSTTATYPTSITANGTLPADLVEPTTTSSTPPCVRSTSGSGTTEHWILTCTLTESAVSADNGSYTSTFTASDSNNGASNTSGLWSLTVTGPSEVCTSPANAGTATTFHVGVANTFSVACYGTGFASADAGNYPASITLTTPGTLPADVTEATSTSSSPACTTSTSGSGLTEQYILTCAVTETPTTGDEGSYTATFTATPGVNGGTTVTSGNWNLTVSPPTTTCSAPAAAGTTTSFTDGTASSYSVTCASAGYGTAQNSNYPTSITLNTGTLPADANEATSTSSSPVCTHATSGSGVTELYELVCPVTQTPTSADNGTYPVTFLAIGGLGAGSVVSGTWTLKDVQPAPSWATSGSTDGNYDTAIKGVPFCYDIEVSAGQVGPSGTNGGSAGSLPLTSLTAGATPANVANYTIQDVNLALGTAQLCGTNNNNVASAPVIMAPVATNTAGSATDSIPLWSQNECTWTSTGSGLTTQVSQFDPNQDLYTAGSQSAFGQAITNGVQSGLSLNTPTCPGNVGVSASGGLGDAWTMNTSNPLPTPTDDNPSAALGDLPSSNLDLASASGGAVGGCWGATNILASTSTSGFGSGSTARMTLPSTWANGGDCAYGSLGSNSAGGNTDTQHLMNNGSSPATGNANCPPTQADVNAGLVSCAVVLSSGNDENGSVNYSSLDLFYNGQPVPQTPTATLSSGGAQPGGTVTVSGGTNWWGSSTGAPNPGPYGDFQNGPSDMYAVSAPQILIGTSRGTAVPVTNSTVTINGDSYKCHGAESTTVGPNACDPLTVGHPTGTFTVPAGLTPGIYNIYIDESNTTPLPGNGPNDAYQTAQGTNLGTAESSTPFVVGPPLFNSAASTTFAENDGTFTVSATGAGPVTLAESGALPSGVTFTDQLTGNGSGVVTDTGLLAGTPAYGTAGTYNISFTATDGNGQTTTQNFTLTVNPSAPTFTSAPATSFSENSLGSFSVTANGDAPISFSTSGLPSGVTLASDGTLSGTPAYGTAGSYPVTITATDGNANTATQAFTLTVVATVATFTSGTSTTFTENSPGAFSVTANGDAPVTFSTTSSLPSGVTLSSGGSLSGTPAFGTAGTYPITITATDGNANTAPQFFTLTVSAAPPVFTSGTSTAFSENSAGSFSVTANGDAPVTFSTTSALPSGVILSSSGSLSGTPAFGTAGTYPLTITATDGNANTTTQAFTLTVGAQGAVFTSANSTTFTENSAETFSVTANGDAPITFSTGSTLPSGVTLTSGGMLSGTPAFGTAGTYNLNITATDGHGNNSNQAFTLTVAAGNPVFTSGSSTTFTENSAGSFSVTANGDAPVTFSTGSALPSGVTLSSGGSLSGTPAFGTAGTYPITITATDGNANTATQAFTLTVGNGNPVFTSGSSTTFTENSAGSFSVSANGDAPVSFSKTGALPSGVTLSSGGSLSGTPAFGTAGTYNLTITATDGNANTATQAFTLTVSTGPPAFTSAASTSFTENSAGSFSVNANGDAPLSYSETGPLPSGVTLSAGGVLSGTPAYGTAGTYPLTVTVTDTHSATTNQSFVLTVNNGVPVITSAGTVTFTEGVLGGLQVTATGDAPITYTESGALPSGVTLSSSGLLSGTPGFVAGQFLFTITATDTHGDTGTQGFTLFVEPTNALHISTTSLPAGLKKSSYSGILAASGGSAPYTWSLVAGDGALPKGLTLNTEKGKITGTVSNKAVTSTFTIRVADSSKPKMTAQEQLTITIS